MRIHFIGALLGGAITLATATPSCAQFLYQTDKELERRALSSTTTYVQLVGDKDYDARIREALAEGWNLTRGIEFVPPGESLGDPGDERRSYISVWRLHSTFSQSFLVLWQGGKVWSSEGSSGSYSNVEYWKSWVVAVPIDAVGRETKDEYVAWRLPLAIRSMVQMVNYLRTEHPGVGRAGLPAADMHGLLTSSLKGKTLLLWNGRFSEEQITLFNEHYPYRTEVVDMKVILDAITNRDPAYAILVCADGGGQQTMSVHDAATRDLLFSHHEQDVNYKLDPKTVKALAKAVD